ncbi:hypothetical protein TNCV_2846621 [Trichonephila clavipes]|nr:hypothetical protein TNCV_2846621 [Trichonephila clavipes]
MESVGVVIVASSESDDFVLLSQVDGATTHQKICVFLFRQGYQCWMIESATYGFETKVSQKRMRRMLSGEIVLLRDHASPSTAATTQKLLDQLGWENFDHPPYSPELAPSNCRFFP